jgi:hypothetical protein
MRFQIQNTKLRITFSITPQKDGTEVHHEERQISGIGDSLFFDIHPAGTSGRCKIIQAPILLGIPEIELDLKT